MPFYGALDPDGPALPYMPFNLFVLHTLADKKNLRITEILQMPEAEILQYLTYYAIQNDHLKKSGKK